MKAIDILNSHSLKRTSCREGIIDVIMITNQALSENEIRERLSGNYDRTTFYRSFKTLEEHDIIHKIVIDNQIVKYALDTSIMHKNGHAHFFCNECHMVQCLESVTLQNVELPEGYTEEETEIIIKGTCAACKK
ncbi:MAG: transcriptional repressor [Bacteroidia bacterium]|nr:transcriptional repressor [Bacteroidia bacterium]